MGASIFLITAILCVRSFRALHSLENHCLVNRQLLLSSFLPGKGRGGRCPKDAFQLVENGSLQRIGGFCFYPSGGSR